MSLTNNYQEAEYNNARFGDVKLEDAIIAWTARNVSKANLPYAMEGHIRVIPKAEMTAKLCDQLGCEQTDGDCMIDWKRMKPEERLMYLYRLAMRILVHDGLLTEDVHKALMVIPEYRDSLIY